MKKSNLILGGLAVAFLGYYSYTVFLADDALINRTEIARDAKGGYQVTTKLLDGTQLIETYEVNDNGSPLSHTLASLGTEPGSKPVPIKKGKFVPKFK